MAFSRQRYWETFNYGTIKTHHPLDSSELPLIAPDLEDFKPTGDAKPPLSKADDWISYKDDFVRETNTMPQWAGSCWYYLRYCDPHNSDRFIAKEADDYWMNVDLYVGGTEHAVLHLLQG